MIIATAFVRLLVISPHAYNGSTGTAIPVNAIHYVDKRTMYTDSHIEAQMLLCVICVVVFIRVQKQRNCRDPK